MFTGPFAGEFAQTWRNNEDAFIRGIIADQRITDQEWAEVVARMKACFESEGMSVKEYNPDGSYSFDLGSHDAETGNRLATGCEESSGVAPVGRLRISMQTNPDNRDMDELMHECLVRVGAVPKSYGLDDYRRDNSTFSFPFVTEGDKKYYDICAASPLTAQRGD